MSFYYTTTSAVSVTVRPEYDEQSSLPFDNYYSWAYFVKIRNNLDKTVQLLNRHWIIVDDKGHITEVKGAGVIGLQPILAPGEEFEYSSSVILHTSSGLMMGTYGMVTRDNESLEVSIPPFSLDCPYVKKAMN